MPSTSQLYYGDNLEVLRQHIADESVDLIYLDPPFNSNATYNVLFKSHEGDNARAQIEAFDDTWHWGPQAEEEYNELTRGRSTVEVAGFIEAMRTVLGTSDMLAYLVMMAPRLMEMRRVMKSTASIYLHCDQTASHYLKLLMDAVFTGSCFQNEIIWQYSVGGRGKKRFARKHDNIFFYTKTQNYFFDQKAIRVPMDAGTKSFGGRLETDEDGRQYRLVYGTGGKKYYKYYLDEGKIPEDVWQIQSLQSQDRERLGYPTQKPLALLERIIKASCPIDGVVLDPFCGCGTTVDAAQQLGRKWIGIDITYIAVDLIIKRLQHRYGDEILDTFTTNGIPKDVESADALFERNPFDFERWAVSMVNGQPNDKQVGDRGVDGRIRYDAGTDATGIAVVSVKGGQQLNPAMVRDLAGTMGHENSNMGVLVTRYAPTRGMMDAAKSSGTYQLPKTLNKYPKIQMITVAELLEGKRPNMPPVYLPYIKAKRKPDAETVPLF